VADQARAAAMHARVHVVEEETASIKAAVKEHEVAEAAKYDELCESITRFESTLKEQGNEQSVMMARVSEDTTRTIDRNMADIRKRLGQQSRHITLHRESMKALKVSRDEMRSDIEALGLSAQDGSDMRKAMYLQLDAKLKLQERKIFNEVLAAKVALAERIESLAREMQAATEVEKALQEQSPKRTKPAESEPTEASTPEWLREAAVQMNVQ